MWKLCMSFFVAALFLYEPQATAGTRVVNIPKSDVVAAYNDIFQTMDLVIDNYGGKKKSQWYRQQSYLRLPTGEKVTFDVPRFYLVLKVPVIKTKRFWHYYINELELDRVRISAADNGVQARLEFESEGNEIKGKCTRRKLNGKDNCEYRGKRDIQLDNARLHMQFRSAVVGNYLGYTPVRSADMDFSADVKIPAKLCKRLRTLSWISFAMGAVPVTLGADLSQGPCQKMRSMAIDYVKQRAAERLRHSFNQPQVRQSMAKLISHKVGFKLKPGEKLLKVRDRGQRFELTIQTPPRQPGAKKPAFKPTKAVIANPVRIAHFEAQPKVLIGKCPGVVKFSGAIQSAVKGTVNYYFENHKGVRSGVYQMKFDHPGTNKVVDWQVPVDRPKRGISLAAGVSKGQPGHKADQYEMTGFVKLVVKSPWGTVSRTADYKVDCDKPKVIKVRRLSY